MPDNLALLDKTDDILNTDSAETQEDCGCPFKKAGTQEAVSNAQNVQGILIVNGEDGNDKESDIVLESKVQPSGGSAVDIKVAATGTC
ncbi:hypothetical protein [Kamptonema sp. UHCC 0994]|uniref:hypothetical protein n=1 Tax=Kamptonema sp. UHCC 0994 TaxID=3031329 RepID=UPI0023B8DD8B|nr:hypothetical protein [Kamptonema sp. UHCC 0994]MDF0553516.1 hypothetical protein [Kamptonema sp. UHCC 0994]